MGKRTYTPAQQYSTIEFQTERGLPTTEPIAVYYRQSTDVQVGNVSTTIQTVDMVQHLQQRGWKENDIYLIDMDAGVSGTKRIDQRPGMRKLFELIAEGQIKAVACQDEDRLFRDVTQIQVNIFIEACRTSNVLVITPSMVYDFAHPQLGPHHARQFRFKSEMAAEYLTSFVIGRLHRSRKKLAMEGRWVGGSVPPGFMVDLRKTLPDGTRNENWRRYVPFAPYAEVVNGYFRLFLECGGNINLTKRRIYKEHLSYPDPSSCRPPEGFRVHYGFKGHEGGYYPGRTGLKHILTNAAYIGHWIVNDAVVRWNNHSAIVPTDIFLAAFNYLSETTLDGNSNAQFRPYREYAQPLKDDERPVERPLLSGMIFSLVNNEWRAVGTEYVKRQQHYRYLLSDQDPVYDFVWSKNAAWVDNAVVRLLHEKLRVTFDAAVWQKSLDEFEKVYRQERRLRVAQITALEQSMQNLIAGIEQLSDPDFIRAVEKRYEDAKTEHKRLTAELAAGDHEASQMELIAKLKDSYESTIANWDAMTREEKRVILQAFVDRVEAEAFDKHKLRLFVCWRDGQRDKVNIPRLPTYGDAWSQEEHEQIIALVNSHATQEQISVAFANRTWRVIRDKIARTIGLEAAVFTPKPIRDFERYDDYLKRIEANPDAVMKVRHTWRKEEIARLLELLEGGTTKMEVAQAFPYRKWTHIRSKISELKGHDFEVPGDKPMNRKESYEMYLARIDQEQNGERQVSESQTGTLATLPR